MLKLLLTSRSVFENWLVLVRIAVGIIIGKYGLEVFHADGMKGNVAWLTDVHMPAPVFMAYLGKSAELIGGVLLVAGLFTRMASMVLIINMTVIIFLMGNGNIFGDAQLPFLLFLFFASFMLAGAGKWSLDYLLFDKKANPR